jgi:hypothetical protein
MPDADPSKSDRPLDTLLLGSLHDGGDTLVQAAHLLCDVYLGLPELTEDAWKKVNTLGGLIYNVLVGAMTHLVENDRAGESFILAQRWKTPLFARPIIDKLQTTVAGREELELASFFAAMDALKQGVLALMSCTSHESGVVALEQIMGASSSVRTTLDLRSLTDPIQAWRLGRISYPDELIDVLQERGGAVCLVDLTCSSKHMFVHILGRDGNRVQVLAGISPFSHSQVLECADVYQNFVVRQLDPDKTSGALDYVCNTLHQYLWCKLARSIGDQGFSQIILVPDAWTRGLPHHLSTLCGDEISMPPDVPVVKRDRLADLFPLEVAPSVQSVAITHWQLRPRNIDKLVMACDPNDDLSGAAWSAHYIKDRLANDLSFMPLVGPRATKANVLREMKDARLIVFSGHGDYLPDDIPSSYLRFSDQHLTFGEIVEGQGVVPGAVYVLSCCELGTGVPGETIQGFAIPGALLAGGAACVVSALWEMEDVSFGYLTDRFMYRLAHPGWRPAAALFRAMNDVKKWALDEVVDHIKELLTWMAAEGRDEKQPADYLRVSQLLARVEDEGAEWPFADPKYWGGAVVHGCGWSGLAGAAPTNLNDDMRQMEVILSKKPQQVQELIATGQLKAAAEAIEEWLAWAHGSERIIPFELQAELMERARVDRRAVVNQYRRLELMSKAHEDHEMALYAAQQIERIARC